MMNFINQTVRRQDRLLEEDSCIELLRVGEYGFLSMRSEDGEGAYGIPLSFVWDGYSSLYVHCAPSGRKLECLKKYPSISFCIVGKTCLIPNKFTTEYECVLLEGVAKLHLSPEERIKALKLILEKYSPNDMEIGLKYTEKSFHRTEIIRLDILTCSGKCKKQNR